MASPAPAQSAPAPASSGYVRPIKPNEVQALADVWTRAFARDPSMNWFGGVRALVPHHSASDAGSRRTLAGLGHFQLTILKMGCLTGTITVLVERTGEGEGEERVVGGAMWLPPGTSMDPTPLTFVRISPWRAVWAWGLGGMKRMLLDFTPGVEKTLKELCKARERKLADGWQLFEIAVDPEHEGKGYCSMLMRDGFERAAGAAVHLEATTPKSRDIYAHLGFEIGKEQRFGVGSVDEMGVVARGEAAVGWPVWVMSKWETP
ncbi:hypothetical protein BC834DRAFT_858044 [Gloeopeniophorella convolvens]|nr:hypothetical protein BC834DRAFT_858044 [Gloeopeniophorella convolvens]